VEKGSKEAIELFKTLSENSQQFPSKGRQGLKGKGIHEESTNGGIHAQMAAMEKKLDMLMKAMTSHSSAPIQQVTQVKVCAICSYIDHTTKICPMFSIVDQKSFLINLSQHYYEEEPSPIYWPSQYQKEEPSLIYDHS
jgi:hypothetical protein